MNTFSNREFYKEILFQQKNEGNTIKIKNIMFNEVIEFYSFDEFTKSIFVDNCYFEYGLDMSGVHFKAPVLIQNCEIEKLHIGSCGFKSSFTFSQNRVNQLMEFWDTVFYKMVKFDKNDFLGGCNLFNKYDSYGSVQFKGGLEFF